MSVTSRNSTRESKIPVTQLVFLDGGAFLRSTPCVCALWGFLLGPVLPDRTTRRHGLACPPPNLVGWAGRVVTFGGAAGEKGNLTFRGVVAARQPASGETWLVLVPLVRSAAGGAPQRQAWLSPAGSMADRGGDSDPPGVEVPGAGADETSPPEGGSSVENRHIKAGTTDAGARGPRTLFQPLPLGLNPTGTRSPEGAPSGSTDPEAAVSGAGAHFGVGQLPDVTTWGGMSAPPPAKEPAGESSRCAPPGSRNAQGAPALEHSTRAHVIGPPAHGPGGRSPLGA